MHPKEEIKIKPPGSVSFDLSAIWQYRELLYFFVWRDLKVKYKQAYLGMLWAILQPLLLMGLFYFIFFRSLGVDVGMNYSLFAFSGLVLWGLFYNGINQSSESLLSNAPIIRKIYFPRLLIPLSSIFSALIDFMFALVVLIILVIALNQSVDPVQLAYPLLAIIIILVSALGIGTLLSALTIKYKDFRYLLPFLLQVLFFGSQVVYSMQNLQPAWLKKVLYIHPMNGALELFRAPFYNSSIYWPGILTSITSSFFFLIIGLYYFKKTETYFADVL
jgi:lipopolysaccharide transport system permease protein